MLALLQSKAGDYRSRKCFPLLNSPVNSVNFMFSLSRGCLFYRGGSTEGGVYFMGCLSTMVAPVFLRILGKDFALETGWMPLTIPDT